MRRLILVFREFVKAGAFFSGRISHTWLLFKGSGVLQHLQEKRL